ncbi:MAG: hypothetical protein IPP00_02455 [Actinomycetales bacterium]|uniref:Uncharacterized protein n=1 Tax=Candidatus Phosphoribacter hodrii TaxID=2953743 RepID=A0A9D7T5A4_9MICO|nr:hypothetical protein [Candidatus Phosphoribacter hodrii]
MLPDLGANPTTSRGWASDLLSGLGTTKLQSAAIGQFDGVGAGGPGSSIFGSADSRVNPWAFVLMLEGVTWFASSAARRLGETESKAAMPFTVFSSADGPIPGAVNEGARGELWAPVFAAVTAPHLTQIMREARAVWQGRAALRAAEMYGAVHTFGVDRGIDRFQRFGLLQRNGLAFVAVLLDTVEVSNRPTVSLAAAPIRRARGFDKAPGEATKRHTRVFDAAALNYLASPAPNACSAFWLPKPPWSWRRPGRNGAAQTCDHRVGRPEVARSWKPLQTCWLCRPRPGLLRGLPQRQPEVRPLVSDSGCVICSSEVSQGRAQLMRPWLRVWRPDP